MAQRFLVVALVLAPSVALSHSDPPQPPALTPEQQKRLDDARKLVSDAHSESDLADALEKALAIERDVFGKEDPRAFPTLERLASVRQNRDEFEDAVRLWREAVDLRTKAQGDQSWRTASSRASLAHAERVAKLSFEQRARLAEADGMDDKSQGLFWKGVESPKALELAQEALRIRKELLTDDDPACAASMNNVGVLARRMGDYQDAVGPLQQALDARRRLLGEDHPLCALTRSNLGMAWYALGDFGRAEPLLRQAAEGLSRVADPHDLLYVAALNNLGVLYTATGDRDQAEPVFQQALDAVRLPDGAPEPPGVLTGQSWPGVFETATAEFNWSLSVKPTYAPSPNRRAQEGRCLSNLGLVRLVQGDAKEAESRFRQAQKIFEDLPQYAKDDEGWLACMNNLALVSDATGDYAAAEPLLRRVVKTRRSANSVSNLGLLCLVLGKTDEAEQLLREALKTRQNQVPNHPSIAVSLDNLAVLAQVKGDTAEAESLLRQALELARRHVDLAADIQTERQQLALTRTLRGYLDHYLSLPATAQDQDATAYEEVLAWKGSVLARQRRVRDLQLVLRDGKPREVGRLAADLDRTTRRLAAIALNAPATDVTLRQNLIDELTRRKEQLERDLAHASAEFRRHKEAAPTTADSVKAALAADAVLVDFLEYDHFTPPDAKGDRGKAERRLTAFVVAPGKDVKRLDLGPAAPVEKAVDEWRACKGRVRLAAENPGPRLRSLVWEPLRDYVKNAKTVLISPDGALGRFPMAALPGAKPNSYLVEEVGLCVVPASQLLPELMAAGDAAKPEAQAPDAGRPSLLLVGDVDFGADPGAPKEVGESRSAPPAPRGKTLSGWNALSGTAAEIDGLKGLFTKSHADGRLVVLRGKDATEEAFRENAPGCRWLHVATHGFFAPPQLRSALSGNEEDATAARTDLFGRRGVAGFHPGLLCGLVLAGANRPPEPGQDDGILTASEVAVLDLRSADLAVLSACETGLGETAGGEGVLGLQRAFQVAGARTVVASLWPVSDDPTRVLMERFYSNLWNKKMSKLESLREAQLWMLREGRGDAKVKRGMVLDEEKGWDQEGRLPPFYWAAFVVSGDWR